MTAEVIQQLGVAGFAILVIYLLLSRLLGFLGGLMKNNTEAIRENAAAVNQLRTWMQTQEVQQIERDNDHMTEIRASFDRQRSTLDNILLAIQNRGNNP
jgi:hypothetical protein